MDRATVQAYAARLDATGLKCARSEMSGGNRIGWLPVDWESAIVRLMTATGWTIIDERTQVDPAQLRLEP